MDYNGRKLLDKDWLTSLHGRFSRCSEPMETGGRKLKFGEEMKLTCSCNKILADTRKNTGAEVVF